MAISIRIDGLSGAQKDDLLSQNKMRQIKEEAKEAYNPNNIRQQQATRNRNVVPQVSSSSASSVEYESGSYESEEVDASSAEMSV